MKRFIVIIFAALFSVIVLTSCQNASPGIGPGDAEPEKTEGAGPAVSPSEQSLPIELEFDSSAEKVVSLVPGSNDPDVHYPGLDIENYPPNNFYFVDGLLYMVNYEEPGTEYDTILAIDAASGSVDLIRPERDDAGADLYNIYANPFVIQNGMIIMHNKAYDMANKRMYTLSSPIPEASEYASLQVMYAFGSDVYLSYDISEEHDSRMVCRFDRESMQWSEPEPLFGSTGAPRQSTYFFGMDAQGNAYYASFDPEAESGGHFRRIIEKYDPDGTLVSLLPLTWFEEDLYGSSESSFRVTGDGTVYVLAPFTSALEVFRVSMG